MQKNTYDTLEKMYLELYDRLYRRALGKMRDANQAADMVDETFLCVILHQNWWGEQNDIIKQQYLFDTMEKLCEKNLDKQKKYYFVEYNEQLENSSSVDAVDKKIVNKMMAESYMECLDPEEKMIMESRFYEEKMLCDISKTTKLAPNIVSKRISRCKKKLRKHIEKDRFL